MDDERSVTVETLQEKSRQVQDEANEAKTTEDVQKAKRGLDEMRRMLCEGVEWWAQFDVRRGQKIVENIEVAIDSAQQRVRPRRRFKFKSATKPTPPLTRIDSSADASKKNKEGKESEDENRVSIVELKVGGDGTADGLQRVFKVETEKIQGRGVRVGYGEGRRVVIDRGARSLWLVKLIRCVVDISEVDGPIWIRECSNCVFRCSCRQLRVHHCSSCSLRMHVVGAPILEDCTDIRIGPPVQVAVHGDANLEQQSTAVKGNDQGRWKDIVDMSWLREGDSANWRFMTDGEDEEAVVGASCR